MFSQTAQAEFHETSDSDSQAKERDYFPCDHCSCIMEDSAKLEAHVRRYHKDKHDTSNIMTPPSSEEEVVTPKNKVAPSYERNSTMCEPKVIYNFLK